MTVSLVSNNVSNNDNNDNNDAKKRAGLKALLDPEIMDDNVSYDTDGDGFFCQVVTFDREPVDIEVWAKVSKHWTEEVQSLLDDLFDGTEKSDWKPSVESLVKSYSNDRRYDDVIDEAWTLFNDTVLEDVSEGCCGDFFVSTSAADRLRKDLGVR